MKYQEIKGNLITLAKEGYFDVIAHGCNCFCTMGAGLAPQMAKAFGCDKFELENEMYRGDVNKLGAIDWAFFQVSDGIVKKVTGIHPYNLEVVNCYSQFGFGINHAEGSVAPLDYEALTLCFRKMNHIFKGKHIGLPQIGCHLAGGVWDEDDMKKKAFNGGWVDLEGVLPVKTIIQNEFKDCDVTVVIYENK